MLWVGTYRKKGGKGLQPLEISGGQVRLGEPVAAITNASFGVTRGDVTYFVDEQEAGRVAAWRRSDGRWMEVSSTGTAGGLPCFLALHPDRDLLAVANYADGALSLMGLDEAGGLGPVLSRQQQQGRGSDPERQQGPHAHCAVFSDNGKWLFHVDLGLDRVFRYAVEENGLGKATCVFEARPGSGPRHLVLCPEARRAVLICELSAEILLLDRDRWSFRCLQVETTLPERFSGQNLGGHLHVEPVTGRILATNRGHDSLVSFEVRENRLERLGWARTGGTSPRHFWTDGERAVVANEESGTVALVPLPREGDAGLAPLDVAEVPGAAFVFETPY